MIRRFAFNPGSAWVEPAEDDTGKEINPNLVDPLEGTIDPYFGHGTFIAGLVRQQCPDADLLSIKLMGPDGVVDEADLIARWTGWPTGRRVCAVGANRPIAVDVVLLSLGYYHEDHRRRTTTPRSASASTTCGRWDRGRRRGRQRQHHPAVLPGRLHPVPERSAAGR